MTMSTTDDTPSSSSALPLGKYLASTGIHLAVVENLIIHEQVHRQEDTRQSCQEPRSLPLHSRSRCIVKTRDGQALEGHILLSVQLVYDVACGN